MVSEQYEWQIEINFKKVASAFFKLSCNAIRFNRLECFTFALLCLPFCVSRESSANTSDYCNIPVNSAASSIHRCLKLYDLAPLTQNHSLARKGLIVSKFYKEQSNKKYVETGLENCDIKIAFELRRPCLIAASPKKGYSSSKMPVTGRQTADRGGEGDGDFSDEDVHSDDEFNFVEDKQQTLSGMQIPRLSSVGTASSTGSFSVRFEG